MLLQVARASCHTLSLTALPTWCTFALPAQFSTASTDTPAASSHYEVLGVERTAPAEVIKKAFRQRAKALHPDLNTHLAPAQAQEAFLRLVAAYEVLSDEQQRCLYDAATDPALPRVLRRAAAAQQQQAADAAAGGTQATQGAQAAHDAGLNWRWGLADWARYGPAASPDGPVSAAGDASAAAAAASAGGGHGGSSVSGMRQSALSALKRHQRDLEVELHAALMIAFLGPTLNTRPGELPVEFECDERSHPSLTDDLLHLVHGRTLLGVVTTPATLRLEGGSQEKLQLPHSSSAGVLPAPSHSTASFNADGQLTSSPAPIPSPVTTPGPATPQQPHTQLHQNFVADIQQQQQQQEPGEQLELHSDGVDPHSAADGVQSQGFEAGSVQDKGSGRDSMLGQGSVAGGVQDQTADVDPSFSGGSTTAAGEAAAAEETAADPDAEISDEQWRELLQKQHPLLGQYDWRQLHAAAAAASNSESTAPAEWQQPQPTTGSAAAASPVQGSASASSATDTASSFVGSTSVNIQQQQQQQQQRQQQEEWQEPQQQQQQQQQAGGVDIDNAGADSSHGASSATLGGRAGWEAYMEAVAGLEGAHGASVNPDRQLGTVGAPDDSSSCPQPLPDNPFEIVGGDGHQQQLGAAESWQQQWHRLDRAAQLQMQQQWYQQWQEQQDKRHHPSTAAFHDTDPEYQQTQRQPRPQPKQQHQQQHHQQHQQQQQQQQQQGQAHHQQQQQDHQRHHKQQQQQPQSGGRQRPRSGHRRLWRWLRAPSADWLAADWSFTDEREGVLVLQLVQEGGLAAVGVRDEQQDLKPIKVYVDGVLLAAVLDDVMLQPLTGKLMAVMYKWYTPGVHHVYFMLPNTPGASRVMARLRRRWLPPSATWLFPPRVDSHDRCSWVLEWEGFNTQHRPGWLHPAVYVMTAAYTSYDLERKRLQRRKEGRVDVQLWLQRLTDHTADMLSQVQTFCRLLVERLHSFRSR